jgi:acetylornithine deacetylase/succinyl-diaminopimelate desuccinylase-like protein
MPASITRRRTAGAFAVAVAATLANAPALAAQTPAPAAPAAARTPHQQFARSVYQELVEINTVDSVGSTTRAAEAMAARFRAAGFPAADVRVLVPAGKPTKGNLVVRYRARPGAPNAAKPLLLLAHLDVVAANRADWPRDPFVLHEENGYFLGRGTADDKAMAAIFVANLLRARREGWAPARDVVLALTADEEGGDANGVEFLIANHRPLIDAAYALNEGGGGVLQGGRPVLHSIQAAEKVPVNFTLTVTNPGGHSSVPRPDNAITQLADALGRVGRYQFPVALNEVTRPFFARTAAVEARADMAAAMRALGGADSAGAAAGAAVLSRDPRYASMLRTTCVATRLAGGHAYNALPQSATANVNCRVAPTSNADETRALLARAIGDTAVRITPTLAQDRERFGAAPSAVEPALLSAVTDLTRATWGANVPVIPTMSTGATDGRYLRAAGVATYGVSGLFSEPGENNAHGRDEKLRVQSFYEGLDFLDRLVRRLAGRPQAAM